MDHYRNNPFDEEDVERRKMEDVSKMKEWVSKKLKELEDQNSHLKEENRKFNEELSRLKEFYVKKSYTPEVRKKFSKRDLYLDKSAAPKEGVSRCNDDSSSSDEEFFVTKSKYTRNLKPTSSRLKNAAKINQPRIDGAKITLLSGNSRPIYASRAGSLDRKLTRMKRLNFTEMKKQKHTRNDCTSREQLVDGQMGMVDLESEAGSKPPTLPLHRCPSWESRIYEIANNGIKSAISTPVQQVKKFPQLLSTYGDASNDSFVGDNTLPIFKNVNGRLAKIRMTSSFDESMSSDFESFTYLKSNSTTSSGNESDLTHELKMYIAVKGDSDSEQDYALPPDAIDNLTLADTPTSSRVPRVPTTPLKTVAPFSTQQSQQPTERKLEKSGYLLKLSGRIKTWKRRWFLVKDGSLYYYKSQEDFIKKKPRAEIVLDHTCKLIRLKECTFHLSYKDGRKNFHLSADSVESHNDWVRVITHTLTYNNIFKLQANQVPLLEGYLVKGRFGHSLKCWATLYGQYLIYFNNAKERVPMGYTHLKNAQVKQLDSLENLDDTVCVAEDSKQSAFHTRTSISIHANDNSEPVYLRFLSQQDFEQWSYHVNLAASAEHKGKTAMENYLVLLTNLEASLGSEEEFYGHHAWDNPIMLFTSENLGEPLTSLSSDALKSEALKLFKAIQLFISVPVDLAAIDYHVSLIQNSLQVCLSHQALQSELFFQLIKQSTPEGKCKEFLHSNAIHLFLCSPHSLFTCEDPSSEKSSPSSSDASQSESSVKKFSSIFLQCFRFLALAISIFEPKNQALWLLRHHLKRSNDGKSEIGQYSQYCERALQRVLLNGPRKQIPSRMEVLSILQRNPNKHSMPHSIPVHFANGSYQVIGFDGSTTVSEFVQLISAESGIRDNLHSGFALYSDDPLEEGALNLLNLNCKLADAISHWEGNLRKFHLGKFESTKAIKLIYKHRLCLSKYFKNETDRERILWVYEINEEIRNNRFPITFDLAVELMTLLMQLECGDCRSVVNVDSPYQRAVENFLPSHFRQAPSLKELSLKRWSELSGRSSLDCVRIYLNCTRKWSLCGSRIFQVKRASNAFKYDDLTSLQLCKFFSQFPYVCLAVAEEAIELLEMDSLRSILRIPHKAVISFGGHNAHFMLTVNGNMLGKFGTDSERSVPFSETKSLHGQRLLFSMSKRSIIEITMLLADYINLTSFNTLPTNHA